jgi:hypothetical protein
MWWWAATKPPPQTMAGLSGFSGLYYFTKQHEEILHRMAQNFAMQPPTAKELGGDCL